MEVGEEGFGGCSMHVGGRDCGGHADGLGGVLVGARRGVVSSVYLRGRMLVLMTVEKLQQ